MRKRKTVFLLLACLLLTLAAGCGKAPQQPQERSKWDILSAKCGEADCTVSVTKNAPAIRGRDAGRDGAVHRIH